MRVWRLEFPDDQRGAYSRQEKSSHCGQMIWEVGLATYNHPMPDGDGIDLYRLTDDHRYGFSNLDTLCAWFDEREAGLLVERCPNLLIRQFEVPECEECILLGGHQLAFPRSTATLISEELFAVFYRRRQTTPCTPDEENCLGAEEGAALR